MAPIGGPLVVHTGSPGAFPPTVALAAVTAAADDRQGAAAPADEETLALHLDRTLSLPDDRDAEEARSAREDDAGRISGAR